MILAQSFWATAIRELRDQLRRLVLGAALPATTFDVLRLRVLF